MLGRFAPTFALLLACGVSGDLAPSIPSAPLAAPTTGAEQLGAPASDFEVEGWIVDGAVVDADAITLADLTGRVVLVRFWTDTCPFCRATAPALVELDRDFRDRGLVVLGLHHPKPRPRSDTAEPIEDFGRRIARAAHDWGMRFPIGLDRHWRTIDRWWLGDAERSATSASFVLDRQGIIRWIHPGPEFHPGGPDDHDECRADYAKLREVITALLDERAS